ncbi:hypothetical protein V6C07_11240 [Desulfovibrio sp. 1214_IL3152]
MRNTTFLSRIATENVKGDAMTLSSQPSFLNVEKSYRRLLNRLPGMAYRCRILGDTRDEKKNLIYELEFVSRGCYDLLGITAGDMLMGHNN